MGFNKVFHVTDEAELAEIAAAVAPHLHAGAIMSLEGDLGAGKTAFARALIRNLASNPALEVPSPTFTLVQTYETSKGEIWHFDLYRLKHPEEIYELGWEDALASKAILLVEWAERIAPLLPPLMARVRIEIGGGTTRKITVSA